MSDLVPEALRFSTTPQPADPFPFSIDDEVFYCRPTITGMAFIKYSRLTVDPGGGLISKGELENFFADAMESAEHERFRKYVDDPGRNVDLSVLGQIFISLLGRFGTGPEERSRPTEPPKQSQRGRGRTRDGSKENVSSPASTPSD